MNYSKELIAVLENISAKIQTGEYNYCWFDCANSHIGLILQEVGFKCSDIIKAASSIPSYNSYWVSWNYLTKSALYDDCKSDDLDRMLNYLFLLGISVVEMEMLELGSNPCIYDTPDQIVNKYVSFLDGLIEHGKTQLTSIY
jgi:hypothetical protein